MRLGSTIWHPSVRRSEFPERRQGLSGRVPNVGRRDARIRSLVAVALLAIGLFGVDVSMFQRAVLILMSVGMGATAYVAWCPLYWLFEISTI